MLIYWLTDWLTDYSIYDPDIIFQICQKVVDHHAPQNKIYIRGNHKPFNDKRLSKAIMQRTHFRNKFLKNLGEENMYHCTKNEVFH